MNLFGQKTELQIENSWKFMNIQKLGTIKEALFFGSKN